MEADEIQKAAAKCLKASLEKLVDEFTAVNNLRPQNGKPKNTGCPAIATQRNCSSGWGYATVITDRFNFSGSDRSALADLDEYSVDKTSLREKVQKIALWFDPNVSDKRCLICESNCNWFHSRSTAMKETERDLYESAFKLINALNGTPQSGSERDQSGSKGLVPEPAVNMLEKVARFQFSSTGQQSATDGISPFLVNFAFENADDELDYDGTKTKFSFSLRRAYLRIELHRSPLDQVQQVEFEKRRDEERDVQLSATFIRGGGGVEQFGLWELTGGERLIGKFGAQPVCYAVPNVEDTAKLQVLARDIRVKIDGEDEMLPDPAALDVARQWLRLKIILKNKMSEDGEVDISTQKFADD